MPRTLMLVGAHHDDNESITGDMIDIELTRSRNRGFESDCDYAEVFRLAPRPGAVRKAQLLG